MIRHLRKDKDYTPVKLIGKVPDLSIEYVQPFNDSDVEHD
jgi:hypothetical protein